MEFEGSINRHPQLTLNRKSPKMEKDGLETDGSISNEETKQTLILVNLEFE